MSDIRRLPEIADPVLAKLPVTAVGFLILANIVFIVIAPRLYEFTGLAEFLFSQLDLGSEYNFATWCSSMLLLLNALLASILARRYWSVNRWVGVVYTCLAIGFFVLSVDDFIMLHEYVEELALEGLGDEDMDAGFLFGTILAVSLIALTAGPFLRSLDRRNVVLLSGTVGLVMICVAAEVALVQLDCDYVGRCFRTEVVVEEGGELLAILCFATMQYRTLIGPRAST